MYSNYVATSTTEYIGARRVKTLKVACPVLIGLFRQDGTRQLLFEGMPADAKVLNVGYDDDGDLVTIKVYSEDFAIVDDGMAWPELTLKVTELKPHEVKFREFF